MRRSKFYLALVGVLAALAFAIFLNCGGWMMINPEYHMVRLGGLTSAQVRSRLGPPNGDNWASGSGMGPATEATFGPHTLVYFQGFQNCFIKFRNDRVVAGQNHLGFVVPVTTASR